MVSIFFNYEFDVTIKTAYNLSKVIQLIGYNVKTLCNALNQLFLSTLFLASPIVFSAETPLIFSGTIPGKVQAPKDVKVTEEKIQWWTDEGLISAPLESNEMFELKKDIDRGKPRVTIMLKM
ncbi:hypothetical protein BWP24_27590 (plasmid) [Vibrio campbellii]|nr:hypothetical protein BWP24_27590 [Vibrio campbellii]ARR10353.1 unknow [Vibrio campbellii]